MVEPNANTICYGTHDPVIVQFRTALEDIQSRELTRLYKRVPQLNGNSRAAIKQSADHIVEAVLRTSSKSLSEDSSNHARLAEALRQLFQLNNCR
jgi:glutamyl-tRNA reductase